MENRALFLAIFKQVLIWSLLFFILFVSILIFTIDYNIPQQETILEINIKDKIKVCCLENPK
jgi:hypothetical protein